MRYVALSYWVGPLSLFFVGCHPTVGEVESRMRSDAYVQVLETPYHKIELRFVPEALYYLTFSGSNASHPFTRSYLDSLKTAQGEGYGLMFSMTLSPRVDSLLPNDFRNDVIFGQITGEDDYRKTLNGFLSGLSAKIWIEAKGQRHELRTYHMTNSWGMTKGRTFTLLFDPPKDMFSGPKEDLDVVIENLVPGQGRNKMHWSFPISRYDFLNG